MKGEPSLSRIDAICWPLQLDFGELAKSVADIGPLQTGLTGAQQNTKETDKKLLLVTICVLLQWTMEQVASSYRLSPAGCIKYLAQLDRIGIIELKPLNRYLLKLAKTYRWRLHVAATHHFRDNTLLLAIRSWEFEAFTNLRRINQQL